MVEVLLEGLRLGRVRQLRFREDFGAEGKAEVKGGEGEGKGVVKVQSAELKKQWKRDFYANAFWFPLTLHWSFVDEAQSPVAETWQGVCGLVPSLIGLQDAWRESA